jgi:hypothetical protein
VRHKLVVDLGDRRLQPHVRQREGVVHVDLFAVGQLQQPQLALSRAQRRGL